MKSFIYTILPALIVLISAGCDSGPTGPPGPPGNANVFSVNFDFEPAAAAFNGTVASDQFVVNAITPSVVDHGAVLLYFRDQNTWTALPFTVGIESLTMNAVDYTFTLGYGYDDGLIEVFIEASTDDDVVWDEIVALLPPFYEMKAVIIDGFAFGKKAPVDLRDYEAVKAYYGLKD